MFKINEFSKFVQVTPRMLRHYDKVDLFKPIFKDENSGYRYYSAKQIEDINRIVMLRDFGYHVDEIKSLILLDDEKLQMALSKKMKDIQRHIKEEQRKVTQLKHMIQKYRKDNMMNYNVLIKKIDAVKGISVRNRVESYDKEVELWAQLGEKAMKASLMPSSPPFAIYHDGEHRVCDIDIEVVMPVAAGAELNTIEGIEKVASVIHVGGYASIDQAFNYLCQWIEDNDYKIYGSVRQVSLKGAWNEVNEALYETEILIPIK